MYEAKAQGIILHTIWDFSERGERLRLQAKKKAEKWLNELYPKVVENLKGLLSS